MKTYQITEKEIEGMKPVAVGYKIFNNDWTAHGGYDYKDAKGNVLGTIHKVDGDISKCKWGLHFSKLPHHCFDFYKSVQWNKFAKVEAYDKLIDCDHKSVTNILKIIEVYTFDEFVNLIQKELQNKYVRGGNDIRGATKCEGISRCIFCYNKSGKLMAFNKKITEERFNEIYRNLNSFGWYPKFNNAEELKGNLKWYETNIPAIVSVDNKTAWSFMPKEMLEYIKSLPEYNERIFNKVTGDIEDD